MPEQDTIDIVDDIPAHESEELIDIIARLSLDERASRAIALSDVTRGLMFEGIRLRNPNLSQSELQSLFRKTCLESYPSFRLMDPRKNGK